MSKKIEYIEGRKTKEGYSYKVHIPYFDENGTRKFYSKSFSEKKYGTKAIALEQARKHRDEIKYKLDSKIFFIAKHYTLEDIYLKTMSIYQCTLETKRKLNMLYSKYISKKINPKKDFSTIKYDDIQKNLNEMVSIASDDTIHRVFTIWKRLYKYAIANEVIIKDETYNIVVPKSDLIQKKKVMETSFDQLSDVIEKIELSVENKRDSMLSQSALLIMYYTGLRPSEVFGLTKNCIDLKYKTMHIYQSVGTTSTQRNTVKRTKNPNSIRYVPISDELIDILKNLFNSSKQDLLFVRDNGELMNGNYLSDLTRRISKGTFRPYMLRHQFSTDLLLNGVDIRTIQELMGHKNSRMTIEYARSNDKLKINAIANRNNIIDINPKLIS